MLYRAGFRSVRAIAMSRPEDLIRSCPRLGQFGNRSATNIVAAAKRLLESKAHELQHEALEILTGLDPKD